MSDLRLGIEETRGVGDSLMIWVPRVALALLFASIGWSKFGNSSTWIGLFNRIGWGDWFRYLAGGMQIGGAVLLLIPRAVPIGAALVGATLVGAIVVDIALFHSIVAIVPGLLLFGVIFVGLRGALST